MKRPYLYSAVVGILVLTVAACAGLKVYSIDRVDFPNKSGRLDNGLRVVIQPDASQTHVRVLVRYDVGAAADPKEKRGIAHLLEHLAFRLGDELVEEKSTTAAPAAPAASGGAKATPVTPTKVKTVNYLASENAYTNMDATVYYKRVVPAHLEDVLAEFAAQMGDFTAQIDADVFKTEREVIRNERRSRYEGKPFDRVILDLYERLYPPAHPYQGSAVIGSHETIGAIELEDVAAFLEQNYHPGNATLAVVGPVDADQTLALVLKHFGDKKKKPASTISAAEWTPTYREETVVVPEAKETMITVAWPLGPRDSDEVAAIDMLDGAIGGWFSYRLVTNRGYAFWTRSYVSEGNLGSRYVVQALLRNHDDLDAAKGKILEIGGLLAAEVRKADLYQSRRRTVYRSLYDAEHAQDRAESLADYFSRLDHPLGWVKDFERVNGVDFTTAVKYGIAALDRDRAFVMIHTPIAAKGDGDGDDVIKTGDGETPSYTADDAAKAAGGLDHDDRDELPRNYAFTQSFDDFRSWASAVAERWKRFESFTLDNGVRVRVVQQGSLPIMFVHARFAGGRLAEPDDRHGVISVMLDSLGLGGRANRTDSYRIGAYIYSGADSEWTSYGSKFLSVYADRGIEFFAKRVTSPEMVRRSVTNKRDNMIRNLGDAERDISSLATRAYFTARGLGKVWPVSTRGSLERVGHGDVGTYHDTVFYPENLLLTVGSDRPVAEVRALVDKHFGGWNASGKPPIDLASLSPAAEAPADGRIVVVPVKDTAQSQILVGFDTPGWTDWKQQVLSAAVAKLLEEKLHRLRGAMGVTYGTSVNTWTFRNVGSILIRTKVDSAATDDAFRKLLEVVDRVRTEPVTDGNLDFVRRSMVSGYVSRGSTVRGVAETHGWFMLEGRPDDYYSQAVAFLSQLSRDDLQAALDARLGKPGTLVVSGTAPKIPKKREGVLSTFQGPLVQFTPSELLN